jgi:phosphotransferase system enzyme I (PtsI)
VTVRLLDISSDKLPLFLKIPENINTDMELRGAMAVETFSELYITQVKALLRANTLGNMKLLFPMVSDHSDLKTFRDSVLEAKERLKKEKVKLVHDNVKEGIMIETPAAVMLADELASKVDFINIGSNDLLSYTLAAQRGSMLAEKRYHILHPALVKMLEEISRAGKAAAKEVCLCGEVATFEEYYPVLLETGLDSFSVSVAKFPDIKCQLHHIKKTTGKAAINGFYKTESKEDADRYFAKYL